MKNIVLVAAVIVTGNVSADQAVAEPVLYGHKDFVPTPERPIYFRAGNGEYPGATPPLEWREGPVAKIKVAGIYGNPPQYRTNEVFGFSDAQSKNILWKVPVPGWSLSHPIVVGKKVFAVGKPDFVTCWDLETGKQLWQRRIMPLLLDGLPEEKAVAGQKVLDLARALMLVGTRGAIAGRQPDNLFNSGFNNAGEPTMTDHEAFLAQKRIVAGKLAKMVETYRPDVVAFGDEALVKALDTDLAILKRYESVADVAALKALRAENMPGRHDPLRPVNLMGACAGKLGVDMGGSWWGYVGSADSTLISDGERIYGVFDQGQVFCLDLDGKLLWGHREKAGHDNRGSFHRSPLVCGDVVLVRSYTEARRTGKLVRAFDTKTGKLRWEAPLATSNYTVPRLMNLAGQDVLIGDAPGKTDGQQILRVSAGNNSARCRSIIAAAVP
jgi:outer membrane protein assembly factor BamB